MNLTIDKTHLKQYDIESLRGKSNDALDSLWNAPWLKNSINKLDRKGLEDIQLMAHRISDKCETAVVIATGSLGRMIKAVTSATSLREGGADVVVFGDTYSPAEYSQLLTDLEQKDFVLIAAVEGLETVAERGAFVCLKRLLISKYGSAGAMERIYAIAGKESKLIAQDAAESDYSLVSYPQDVPAAYGANTIAALLPMAIKGGNLVEYLDGFHDMLASPSWDIDSTDYSIARALFKEAGGTKENFLIWQRQLADFGKWQECFFDGIEKRSLDMPQDAQADVGETFDTLLLIERDEDDIMMPYFEGCNEDGSLNLLLNDMADKYFFENTQGKTGVKIASERLDSYTLGQLAAFVQLSNGITEFLLNN